MQKSEPDVFLGRSFNLSKAYDEHGNEIDLYNIGQYPYDTWEKVDLSSVDFQVAEADTQDEGLVVVTTYDGNYLLPS